MRLSLAELLTVTDTDQGMLKAWRRRNHVALAFGRTDAYESMSYIALDAVAILLADTLAKSYRRTFAAHLVRVYWDIWGYAVAHAEADPSKPSHFVVDRRC